VFSEILLFSCDEGEKVSVFIGEVVSDNRKSYEKRWGKYLTKDRW
jgi:hypothetical protein